MTNLTLRDSAFLRNIGWSDPYYSNVSLLLHGDGTNGSTTITDSSSSPKTVTAFGNAQISTAQSKFGGASIAFDGNGDYLVFPTSTDLTLSADFTIDFWVYFNALSTTYVMTQTVWNGQGQGFAIWNHINWNKKISFWLEAYNTSSPALLSTTTLVENTWYFVSVQRSGNTFSLWINGVKEAELTTNTPISRQLVTAGAYTDGVGVGAYSLNGYIDDLRVTKGLARYTSNFTPPTAPFPDF